jgi:TPR repeat protein
MNHPQAKCNLALYYKNGECVSQNFSKAFELYQQAALLKYQSALYNLEY